MEYTILSDQSPEQIQSEAITRQYVSLNGMYTLCGVVVHYQRKTRQCKSRITKSSDEHRGH